MNTSARILVVAATPRELATPHGWRTLCCGVGPVDAAAITAAEIARNPPSAILQVGIAGGRRAQGLAPGALVIGSEAHYADLGVPAEWAPGIVAAAPALLAAAQAALPEAVTLAIGTSAHVGGTHTDVVTVEAMEGFAVLRAAQLAGVPALEVRAISNEIEEPDRARWHFAAAFDAITRATPRLVEAILHALRHAEPPRT